MIILLGACLGGAVRAEERFSMPFDCRSGGDGVHLTPGPERSYAILGRRERQVFTACSPEEPDRCRNWFVHRFEFDCNGTRVRWLDAAEAAAVYSDWDAWVEAGRLRMRMGRDWGVARTRPGISRDRWRDRFGARDLQGEDFAPRLGRFVDVPAGFAPAVGVPLTFSGGDEPQVARGPAGEAARDDLSTAADGAPYRDEVPAARAPTSTAQPAAQHAHPALEPVADPPTAKPAAPPLPALPERAPRRPAVAAAPPVTAAPTPEAKPSVSKPAPLPTAASKEEPAAPRSTPSAPTIINGPGAAAKVADYEERPPPELQVKISKAEEDAGRAIAAEQAAPSPASEPELITPPAPVPVESRPATVAPSAPATKMAASEATPANDLSTSSLPLVPTYAAWRGPTPAVVAMAVATVLVLAGLAMFMRGARRPHVAPPRDHDIASISLRGAPAPAPSGPAPKASPAPITAIEAGPHLAPPRLEPSLGSLPAAVEAPAEAAGPSPDAAMPKTYEDALAVLGVSAEDDVQTIKKVVDSLRKTWHPDLARTEIDRVARERRLQRINVAWDLVARRRSAA